MPLNTARTFHQTDDGPDFQGLADAVATFRPDRPYLLFGRPAIPGIRKHAAQNSKLLQRLDQSLRQAPGAAGQELRAKIKKRSRRLIQIAFLALIATGATREEALREARSELSAWAAEKTWRARPVIKSFLDCAEIAVAVALAYDWLHDQLCAEERKTVEGALFRQVIEPALAAYDDRFLLWPKRRDNCTLVSNSGVLVVALAVLDRYPEASLQLIRNSIASSWPIFETLAPDGAWPEGLSYWSLAMRFAGLMVAALESTFGQSFGLAERPGFSQTGDFALHAVGTSGAAFNFGKLRTAIRRLCAHLVRAPFQAAGRCHAAAPIRRLVSSVHVHLARSSKGGLGSSQTTNRQNLPQLRSGVFPQYLVAGPDRPSRVSCDQGQAILPASEPGPGARKT